MDLQSEINQIKIVDHHCHPVDNFYWDEAVGSYPFAAIIAKLPLPNPLMPVERQKTLLRAFKELYNFPHDEVTPENASELDEIYQRSKQDEYKMFYKAMDLAGIESAMEICMGRPVLPPGIESDRFARAVCIDGFMLPLDNSHIGFNDRQKQFVKMVEFWPNILKEEFKPKSFDDYLGMISDTFKKLNEDGVASLKMNHAYWRDIAVDGVEKDEAKKVFEQGDITPASYKRLQDFIMRHMLSTAGELGLPVHIHTGCAPGLPQGMNNADPSRLDDFLWLPDIMNTKIVLLHGSYPFCHSGGFMASRVGPVPNVFLDISVMAWWHPASPQSLVKVLRDWLEMGCAERMLYGSDSIDPLTFWMGAINMRKALGLALTEMIKEGVYEQNQAIKIAKLILHDNAKKLYNGKV